MKRGSRDGGTGGVAGAAASSAAVVIETDPERVLKLKECCDLLLAGGYFRARIPTLSAFDKVVGGLAWSITASGVDVDVDVIFSENASIGAKIRTSDQIVRAMVAMRCPYPLQSHQIQGLDYVHLFPIVQWLVRKVIETRRLTGDSTRLLSVHQFAKDFALPQEARRPESGAFVRGVVDEYRPQRRFRKKHEAAFDSVERRTEATLLEYGEKVVRSAVADEEAEERRRAADAKGGKGGLFAKFDPTKSAAALEQKAKEAEDARRAAEAEEAARLDALQQQMAEHEEVGKLSGANVGNLVGRQADEIRKAMAEYEEKKRRQEEVEAEQSAQGRGKGGEAAFTRQVEVLRKRLAALDESAAKRKEEHDAHERRYRDLQAELAKRTAYVERIHRESDKLSAAEQSSANVAVIGQLKALVALNESLKAQEASFKASCVQQRDGLVQRMRLLTDASASPDMARLVDIEQSYASELSKLSKMRAALAQSNQAIARTQRLIDDNPTRAELLQFERRFVELYALVAAKLSETKKYYALYNTLREVWGYLGNEKSLLESIIGQYPAAARSRQGKEAFVANMDGVLTGVRKQKDVKDREAEKESKARDDLQARYAALTEKQRAYFHAVKAFQEECFKNEQLLHMAEEGAGATADGEDGSKQTNGEEQKRREVDSGGGAAADGED